MLLTAENKRQLPALLSQDGKGHDAVAYVKFFQGAHTYVASEYNPETQEFFGMTYIHGVSNDPEMGYFTLKDLEDFRGQFGLKMERDRGFTM